MEISMLLKDLKLADVETIDKDGNTAHHLTAHNDIFTQKEMVNSLRILLDTGINPDIENNYVCRMKDVVDFLMTRKLNMDSVAHFFVEHEYKKFWVEETFLKLSRKENITDELASNIQRIENESASYIEWLIYKGFDFDWKNESNESALSMAIKRNLQHILPILLKCTKDIHFTDGRNSTLLHSFLDNNSRYGFDSISKNWYSDRYAVDIVKILLTRGVSVDAEDCNKYTSVQTAFKNMADVKIMELLLVQTKKINHKSPEGTLLQMVAKSLIFFDKRNAEYYLKIFHATVSRGANIDELYEIDEYGKNFLCHAVIHKYMSVIEFLRERGADFSVITKDNRNLLHLLARSSPYFENDEEKEIKLLNLLVSKGCHINAKDVNGNTPLHEAVQKDKLTIIEELIKLGADVNSKACNGDTPVLIAAIKQMNPYTVRLLRENGADLNVTTENGETLTQHLLKNNNKMRMMLDKESQFELFDLIVPEDCQINAKDKTGTSLIHLAAVHTNAAVVRFFIERGADVNCRNKQKETPLHFAMANESKKAAVAKMLLEHGAYVNAKDSQGQTALHKIAQHVISYRYTDTIPTLLEYGADVNAQDVNGMTALYYACFEDDVEHEKDRRIWIKEFLESRLEDDDEYYRGIAPADRLCKDVDKWANPAVILLTLHSAKLKAAKLPWDRRINGWHGYFDMGDMFEYTREGHYEECLIEVDKLKKTFIDNRVSLYYFLHMNSNSRYAYLNNEKLQKLVQSPPKLKEQFPEYFVLILANYREANARKPLLEPAKEAWLELTEIPLPDLCLECIFSFLSNSDLLKMIEKD